jgi:organic radical activating enzyme
MDLETFHHDLMEHGPFDVIYLSGGEPLAHPKFYWFLHDAKQHAKHVVVYTNALRHIVYNAHVLDGVRVDANLTLGANTEQLHVLKRVDQGREVKRPSVRLSRNFDHEGAVCEPPCDHVIIRPDGSVGKPCKKEP